MNEEWFEIAKRPPTENDLPIAYWCKELGYREVFCDRLSVDTRWTHWARAQVPSVPSPIAKGHNPDCLTEAQVGVKDGWRLLEEEEVGDHIMPTEFGRWYDSGWGSTLSPTFKSITYRTRLPYPVPFNREEQKPQTVEQRDEAAWIEYYEPIRLRGCYGCLDAHDAFLKGSSHGRRTQRKEDQELVKALEIPKKVGYYNTVCVVESALHKLRASVELD